MNHLVSVVVPTYNQEKYLEKSIPSILKQTYKNIEVIAVNDGSKDRSREILEHYSNIDKRIRIINKENGGVVDAVKEGVKVAIGKYICFVDPDDYIGENFVQNFIDKIGGNDFIAMGYYEKNSNGTIPKRLRKNFVYSKKDLGKYRGFFLTDNKIIGVSNRFVLAKWNKMYKTNCVKQIIDEYGTFKEVSLGEDSIFLFLMLGTCKSGITISAPNEYYYAFDNNMSMSHSIDYEDYYHKSVIAYQTLKKIMNSRGYDDKQAESLYYILLSFLVHRLQILGLKDSMFKVLYRLRTDQVFFHGYSNIKKSFSEKVRMFGWTKMNLQIYWMLYRFIYKIYN